ncbi:DUF302 domain-containing protein [Thiospirillum jenense]
MITHLTTALKIEGFKVFSDIDITAIHCTMVAGHLRAYRILTACNPCLVQQALRSEPNIGLLFPCNIVVREGSSGYVTVAFLDPILAVQRIENPSITTIAVEIRHCFDRIIQTLPSNEYLYV